jgi:hypothetical protein
MKIFLAGTKKQGFHFEWPEGIIVWICQQLTEWPGQKLFCRQGRSGIDCKFFNFFIMLDSLLFNISAVLRKIFASLHP